MSSFGANGTMRGVTFSVLFVLLTLWSDGAVSASVSSMNNAAAAAASAAAAAVVANEHDNRMYYWDAPPSWMLPCGQNKIVIEKDITTWEDLNSILLQISKHAHSSSLEANHKKQIFLDLYFNDSSTFESIYKQYGHQWLPRPPANKEALNKKLRSMDVATAFRKIYGILQHYAVGLEQATLDQMFSHKGEFEAHFRQLQNSLKQLLCEFDMSITLLKIRKDPDVLRDVMSVEQRKPADALGEHQITLRDYVILRDFIGITDYVSKLFKYLSQHPEKRPVRVMGPEVEMLHTQQEYQKQLQQQPPPLRHLTIHRKNH
ncbi:hypothetical protein BIW11_08956 [Tropilaelaps mercedesae]|uniref:Uncharacterized protein n=1 Tax=Tropilaelaps mercedesae TaxID=418985 RepID=A0A1V9XM60_9ACAR|nr:hypothetical protein BIW11_08956 [Tropilaelaps mercedesae]